METSVNRSNAPTQRIGIRYGVLSAVAMIVYFIIINMIGQQDEEVLRFASNLFIIGAVVMAIRSLKKSYENRNRQTPYLPGLAIGFLVGLVGSVIYAAFILFYGMILQPEAAGGLVEQTYYGIHLPLMMVVASIVLLGTIVGAMSGYVLMMAFDNSGGRYR
ncbi:DUF4199 family protein [Nibribacter ruber]|uniref:DUF4199 family protein n=1 Tax=Nibribacter ruber TaxID=2698458 RepID=A0A6P1P2N0_9BACT|nr:DUF4199 domain-containing protein [Nibribacter ruber]QHL88633.1 DUF4199 family protein [Nibribacter ruber]